MITEATDSKPIDEYERLLQYRAYVVQELDEVNREIVALQRMLPEEER